MYWIMSQYSITSLYIQQEVKLQPSYHALLTCQFGELLHYLVFALALWNVANKQPQICNGDIHLQPLVGFEFIVVQLQVEELNRCHSRAFQIEWKYISTSNPEHSIKWQTALHCALSTNLLDSFFSTFFILKCDKTVSSVEPCEWIHH